MVPHLTTALTGPLQDLEQRILDRMPDIERWLRTQWQEHTVPFYASVDLRNAGFKLAPVDTNLFPGGFNNLNPAFLPLCVQAVQAAVERICPDARGVLLVPENHTRNTFYLQNVATLASILRQAGMRVRIGSLIPEITEADDDRPARRRRAHAGADRAQRPPRRARRLRSLHGAAQQRPLGRARRRSCEDIDQPIAPPLAAGWYNRKKSHHFGVFHRVAQRVRELLGHRPLADRSVFRRLRRDQFPGARRRGVPRLERRDAARPDPRQVRANTASRRSRSSSSRPTPAPTAWAS